MFSMYSDSDVTAFYKDLEDILSKHEALPVTVQLHALANTIEDTARTLVKAHAAHQRPLYEPDLVNRLETCAGIIDHNSATIQCRGETTMHRLYEDARNENEVLNAEMETLKARIAELESQVA